MTWSQGGDVGLAAEVGVVVDPGGAGQAALDERYGSGMVTLYPALRPSQTPSRAGTYWKASGGRRPQADAAQTREGRGAGFPAPRVDA